MTFSHEIIKETLLKKLINLLAEESLKELPIIPFASPIFSFGDYEKSIVATMGLNPSDREFLDITGTELSGEFRRFHTLSSLKLNSWAQVTSDQLAIIESSCKSYFSNNPYNAWFRDMENIISATGFSLYKNNACHLDLIPFATKLKWGKLTKGDKNSLLKLSKISLQEILVNSNIELIVLNGMGVVDGFEQILDVKYQVDVMPDWNLPQKNKKHVKGYAFKSKIDSSHFPSLDREVLILGFNHNLQSSFGVTSEVKKSINQWVAHSFKEVNK